MDECKFASRYIAEGLATKPPSDVAFGPSRRAVHGRLSVTFEAEDTSEQLRSLTAYVANDPKAVMGTIMYIIEKRL